MFGCPTVLSPYGDSFDSMSEMQANEDKLAALCQVRAPSRSCLSTCSHVKGALFTSVYQLAGATLENASAPCIFTHSF